MIICIYVHLWVSVFVLYINEIYHKLDIVVKDIWKLSLNDRGKRIQRVICMYTGVTVLDTSNPHLPQLSSIHITIAARASFSVGLWALNNSDDHKPQTGSHGQVLGCSLSPAAHAN